MSLGPMSEAERYRFDLQGFLVRRGAQRRRDRRAQRGHRRARRPAPGARPGQPALRGPPAGGPPVPRPHRPPGGAGDRARDLRAERPPGSHVRHRDVTGDERAALHGGATPFDPAQYYLVQLGRIRTRPRRRSGRSSTIRRRRRIPLHPRQPPGRLSLPATFDRELAVQVPLDAGDLVVFTEALTHGTLPWRAARSAAR